MMNLQQKIFLSNINIINDNFYLNYLRFRIIFYWQEIKSILQRHSLFLILITSSSLNHINYIGYPIAVLIVNVASHSAKLLSICFLGALTIILGKAQTIAITGGAFRDFIDRMHPNNYIFDIHPRE